MSISKILNFMIFFRLSGYLGICFSYLGEFQPKIYREKVLSWLEMFWTVGIILLPCKFLLLSYIKNQKSDIIWYYYKYIPWVVYCSGSLGRHSIDDTVHFWHTSIFVMESVPDALFVAQHLVGLVVDQVPGESKIPVRMRRIWQGARMPETNLHGEYRRTRWSLSRMAKWTHFCL